MIELQMVRLRMKQKEKRLWPVIQIMFWIESHILRMLCSRYHWQRRVGVVQSADRLTFLSLQPLSLKQAVSERSTFRYSVQSKQQPPRAIRDNLLQVCEWWHVCLSHLGSFLQLCHPSCNCCQTVTLLTKKSSHLLPCKWLFCRDCGFLQRLDTRSSPADNGSSCAALR